MNSKKKVATLVIVIITLAVAGYAAMSSKPAPEKRSVHCLLFDDSNSLQRDDRIIRAMVEQALDNSEEADRLDVLILKTGNAETHLEPIVVRELHFADNSGVIEGSEAAKAEHRKVVEETLEAVLRASFDTRVSPIDFAISRTLDQMRGAGCGQQDVDCTLWIRSDGLETEAEDLVRSLGRGKAPKKGLPALNTSGVNIRWCGWAERVGATKKKRIPTPDDASTDLAMSLWHQRLGAKNDTVLFTPFCPKDASLPGGAP